MWRAVEWEWISMQDVEDVNETMTNVISLSFHISAQDALFCVTFTSLVEVAPKFSLHLRPSKTNNYLSFMSMENRSIQRGKVVRLQLVVLFWVWVVTEWSIEASHELGKFAVTVLAAVSLAPRRTFEALLLEWNTSACGFSEIRGHHFMAINFESKKNTMSAKSISSNCIGEFW